jgi:hypothetical protein
MRSFSLDVSKNLFKLRELKKVRSEIRTRTNSLEDWKSTFNLCAPKQRNKN